MFEELNRSFIDGALVSAGKERETQLINPAAGQPFATVFAADPSEASLAAQGAHAAWEGGWRDLAPGKRSDLLFRLADLIERNASELARLDSASMGKPIAAARGEVLGGARTFRYYAGAIGLANGEVIPVARGGLDFTIRQPLGVAACIVPWNFPFAIACWKVAPALAAGNAVVVKPSPFSPIGALGLALLALEAGIPPGVLQVLCGGGPETGEALVGHPLVRKISFTGSTAVGRRVMEIAARDIKRVSLELGGKSPNIVFEDSDWEKAADSAPWSVFDNTGQDCCARSRMFVQRSIYEPFLARFVAAAQKLKVGDPAKEETELGPLVSSEKREAVARFVTEAVANGRRLLLGGDYPDCAGYFYNPTILADVATADRCWNEEIFGPVACVRSFDDEDAMLREVNASPYGLSGSIWTRDLQRALRVSAKVEAGVLSVNCHNSVHTEAPFGGFKQSGMGRDLGKAALEGYTELKNVYIAC